MSLPDLDLSCVCDGLGMATDSGGTHQADGISVDENNVLEMPGPSVFTGNGQQDVTAGVSPCNIMCRCAQQQQF